MSLEATQLVLDELVAIFTEVHNIRLRSENVCFDCRNLLRPWPLKKKKEITAPATTQIAQQPLPNEVVAAEKILQRAEKTRSRYKQNIVRTGDTKLQQAVTYETPVEPRRLESSDINCNNNASGRGAIESEYDHVVTTSRNETGLGQNRVANSSISQSRRKRVVERGAQNYVPVHKHAPFQTFNPVKKVKPGKTRAQLLRETAHMNAKSTREAAMRGGKTRLPSSGVGSQGDAWERKRSGVDSRGFSQNIPPHVTGTSATVVCDEQSTNTYDIVSSHPSAATLPVGNFKTNQQTNMKVPSYPCNPLDQEVLLLQQNMNNINVRETVIEEEEKRFDLLKDGQKLSLPAKYCKLKSLNRKLRQEIDKSRITEQVKSTETAANRFLSTIEEHFHTYYSTETLAQMKMANILCDLYNTLLVLFSRLQKQQVCVTSAWQDVLKMRTKMQHVLFRYTDNEQDFQLVLKNLCKANQYAANSSKSPVPCIRPGPYPISTDYVYNGLNLKTKLKYTEEEQVSKYCGLLHEVQIIPLQLKLVDELSKTLITTMQQLLKTNQTK